MRKINKAGLELIKYFEGLRLEAYKDIVGKLTIGYGHTGDDVLEGQKITSLQAEALLEQDLKRFEKGVDAILQNNNISDNQFSAMVSFSFNLGLTNFSTSTLLKLVNKSQFDKAALEFERWNHAGGKVVKGLTIRRRAERDLFLKPA